MGAESIDPKYEENVRSARISSDKVQQRATQIVRNHWGLLLLEGIAFMFLGSLALIWPGAATLGVQVLIGWLLIIGGVVEMFRIFRMRKVPGIWWNTIPAIFSGLVGYFLLALPMQGMMAIGLLLMTFFFVEGVFKIVLSFNMKPHMQWGWVFASGCVSLILGAIIFSQFPLSAVWMPGMLVGVYMLTYGISLIAVAMGLRSITDPVYVG